MTKEWVGLVYAPSGLFEIILRQSLILRSSQRKSLQ
jgi:hypothetical protein